MRVKDKNCFSVQYHPEASPGPHDSSYLFDQFIDMIKAVKAIIKKFFSPKTISYFNELLGYKTFNIS